MYLLIYKQNFFIQQNLPIGTLLFRQSALKKNYEDVAISVI